MPEENSSSFCKFSQLPVGAVFYFYRTPMVKLADNTDQVGMRLDKQRPNCLNLSNHHYSVVGHNAVVRLDKTLEQFSNSVESDCYLDVEERRGTNL